MLDTLILIMWRLGTVVAGVGSIAVGLLYLKQDSLLYFPEIGGIPRKPGSNPRRYRSPDEHNIPFETHMIPCEDGVSIHSWLLLHPNAKNERIPTLMFFHGNAGNIGLRLPNAASMYHYLKANVMLVEYRGYGDSDDATTNEDGLKLDSEAALRFLSTYDAIDPSRIFVFGRSLGGAVAFHMAQYAHRENLPLAGVIVENTFLSIARMVDHLMPFLAPFKSLILRIGWNSHRIVPHLSVPTLFLAGSDDQLVPHSHMLELYNLSLKASRCARIHIIKDGTHNETWLQGGREYWEKIRAFMTEVFAAEQRGSFSSVSEVPMEDLQQGGTMAVGMGADADSRTGVIPTMPANLVGMTREATMAAVSQTSDRRSKKDK